jgi:secretion/DNA translocation related TadE-like protein
LAERAETAEGRRERAELAEPVEPVEPVEWVQRGSGTVLMLILVFLAGFLIVVCLGLADAVLARHRASAAADLAALAAAGESAAAGGASDENGVGGGGAAGSLPGACRQAEQVAEANAGHLEECHLLGDGSVTVRVSVSGRGLARLLGPGQARARAGVGSPASETG